MTLLILAGVFLRAWHFSSWLHFEIDQDYDILLVSRAVQHGISNLPLLGPNAGGGLLRLGPAYYYMEYLSALVFGDNPTGHAVFVLLLGIFTLPLFYQFIRRYFSQEISLGLLAVSSFSLYSILYSRFAWSPNVLPFLMLAGLYSLLKSVSTEEKNKDRWFLVSIFIGALITQIHFNVFFVVPAIYATFLFYKHPRFHWRVWLSAIVIVLLVYSPMLASEIKTSGQNTSYFFQKTGKSSNVSTKNGLKLIQNVQYFSSEFFLINTGIDKVNGGRMKDTGFGDKKTIFWRISAIIFFLLAIYLLSHSLLKTKDSRKKDFLVLVFLWFFVFFGYFFFLLKNSFNMFPRFFLPLSPIAIIFLGLILEKIRPELNRKRLCLFVLIIAGIVVCNLSRTVIYFKQLGNLQTNSIEIGTEDVLPNTARVTLSQERQVVSYIESVGQKNDYPIYLETLHELEPVIWYQLEKDGFPYWRSFPSDHPFREGNYFLIFSTEKNKATPKKFDLLETKTFGSLTVKRLVPNVQKLSERQSPHSKINLEVKEEFSQVKTWRELFTRP